MKSWQKDRVFYESAPKKQRYSKDRSQSVKFRKKYAVSLFRRTVNRIWRWSWMVAAIGGFAWLGIFGWTFWRTSPQLRVQSVEIDHRLPAEISTLKLVSPGDHLLQLKPAEIERRMLKRFPELASVDVSRTIHRRVEIQGTYREPIALLSRKERLWGVDVDGITFPFKARLKPVEELPLIINAATDDQIKRFAAMFYKWKNHQPEFYSLINRLEIDRIGSVRLQLRDGVVIDWSEMRETNIIGGAENILKLRQRYRPNKIPSQLIVVTSHRIVMDANWEPITK